jgi:hypothetical protein
MGMFRHAALAGFAGLTFAILHATAIADVTNLRSALQVDVSFVLEQLSADEYSSALPALSTDELELLLAGEPVIKVPEESEADASDEISEFGIFGLKIMEAPRLLVWSTVMGAASDPPARLTRAYLSRLPKGSYIRYQHVNLPWPVRDRHWAVLCEKNLDLADSSNGLIWQHRWTLHQDGPQLLLDAHAQGRIEGLSLKDLEKSVYIPANRGAWTLADLGGGRTLVIGYFDAALGGLLPKVLVRTFTRRQMRAGMHLIQDLTNRVHLDYDVEARIHDGYGQPITRQDVLRLAGQGKYTVDPTIAE